jgi:hypothetical protein
MSLHSTSQTEATEEEETGEGLNIVLIYYYHLIIYYNIRSSTLFSKNSHIIIYCAEVFRCAQERQHYRK